MLRFWWQSTIVYYDSKSYTYESKQYVLLSFSVDCLYAPTNHLHHNFEACVLQPSESVNMNLVFYPREAKKYSDIITFEINGLSKQSVQVNGTGTEMKVNKDIKKQLKYKDYYKLQNKFFSSCNYQSFITYCIIIKITHFHHFHRHL